MSATLFVAHAQMTDLNLQVGDTIEFEGKQWLIGPNVVVNPSFNDISSSGQITGWTVGGGLKADSQSAYNALPDDGSYKPMTTSVFTYYTEGGFDGGAYIRSNGSGDADAKTSIVQRWQIEPNQKYYFTFWMRGQGKNNQYVPIVSITPETSKIGGMNELKGADKKGKLHNGTTLLGKNGDDPSSSTYGYSNYIDNDTWVQTSIFFDSEECTWLQFNSRWMPNTTCLDGFYLARLYDPETTSKMFLLNIQLQAYMEKALAYADKIAEFPGLQGSLYDLDLYYGSTFEPITEQEVTDACNEIQKVMLEAEEAVALNDQMISLFRGVEKMLSGDELYPGCDDLLSVYDEVNGAVDYDSWLYPDYKDAVDKLNKAVNDYNYSQTYSDEAPANYTFLVSSPQFCTPEAEPTLDDNGKWVYPNVADYKNGSAPADGSSEGWYKTLSGGDQRLNYVQQRICWNAWSTNFSEISINQDIANIPNGYYSVSADMITQDGCVTDQRVYIKSTMATAESPSLNQDNVMWVTTEPYDGKWETLNTGKIIVSDGKLTIGAVGTGDKEKSPADFGGTNTDLRRGWFCVTNFVLKYYGPLSDEDVKNAFAQRLSEMQALCDKMVFKADKVAFQDSINKYKGVTDVAEMNAAMVQLGIAEAEASLSIDKQNSVMTGITAALADSIEQGKYSGVYLDMAKRFHDCMVNEINADDAAYKEMDSIVHILYAFRDEYVPELVSASGTIVNDATAKSVLDANIERQVNDFTTMETLPLETKIDKYIKELQTAVAECRIADIFASDGTDYTSAIINPTIENSSNTSVPNGWTIKMSGSGNGNYTGSGQQVDGNKSGHYIDAYNGAAGRLLYNAYQTICNLPNGTYRVEAMTRTSGEHGTYLYAMADNDSSTMKLAHIVVEEMNITDYGAGLGDDGLPQIVKVYDSYGSIFANVYDRTDGGATATDADADTINANNGKGYGWHYTSVDIEVKDHILTLGCTTDSTLTMQYGGEPFDGTWFSTDNYTLKLISKGDNSDWNPTTGISAAEDDENFSIVVSNGAIITNGDIYSLSGVRLASGQKLPMGVYIVRFGNQSKKVFVR